MVKEIIIDPAFCGPPTTANGGYTCGLLARYVEGVAEVTLRRPPPLSEELSIRSEGEQVLLLDGSELVATARLGTLDIDVPDPVTPAEATEASKHYIGFSGHPFPTCFVCGPERPGESGLRIFAGRVEGKDLFAAPWTPQFSLASGQKSIPAEFVWAALDCPGAFAIMGDRQRTIVLGRMTARMDLPVEAGAPYVVMGWPLGHDGRKYYCGTAVFNQHRECCALAKATWIDIT